MPEYAEQQSTQASSTSAPVEKASFWDWLKSKLVGKSYEEGAEALRPDPASVPAPQVPETVSAHPDNTRVAPAPKPRLNSYAGYDKPGHQSNDEMIMRVVAAFNAEKGWDETHPHYLDPNLVKAWALQESGGHMDVFTGGDMMQVNNPGDWTPEKQQYVGLAKRQKLDPEQSLTAALHWAYYKGEITAPVRRGRNRGGDWHPVSRGSEGVKVPGYESKFQGWDKALTDYNGGGVADYHGEITRRHQRGTQP